MEKSMFQLDVLMSACGSEVLLLLQVKHAGREGIVPMSLSPGEARKLGRQLLESADRIDNL